jgi:hypothetical protein
MTANGKISFPQDWEKDLETSLVGRPDSIKKNRVYICSPCRAETPVEVAKNMKAARTYMLYSYLYFLGIPKAPHAYLPILLSDSIEDEREIALEFGIRLIECCDQVLVCGGKITDGMYREILKAVELNIPVQVFNNQAYEELIQKFASNGTDPDSLRYTSDHQHFVFAMGADELSRLWESQRAAENVLRVSILNKYRSDSHKRTGARI